jgi:hypothetical protein
MGDKIKQYGGEPWDCCNDTGVCCKVICCGGAVAHYIDAAARFNLFPPQENAHQATKCCGCCTMCYMTTVEDMINVRLGGNPDWWCRFACYYCFSSCKVCQFIRATTTLHNSGMVVSSGQPGNMEMKR